MQADWAHGSPDNFGELCLINGVSEMIQLFATDTAPLGWILPDKRCQLNWSMQHPSNLLIQQYISE